MRILVVTALSGLIVAVAAFILPLGPPPQVTVGTIVGVVRYTSTSPMLETAADRADPCGARQPSVAVNSNGGLANAYVWINQGLEAESLPAPQQPVHLEQGNGAFVPRIVAVQAGQPLAIRSSGTTTDLTKFTSAHNGVFSIGLPLRGSVYHRVFDQPEIGIRLGSTVHPRLRAYIHVSEHPYHTVTDLDGRFKITNLSPGRYTISVWYESAALVPDQAQVERSIGEGPTTPIVFTYRGR